MPEHGKIIMIGTLSGPFTGLKRRLTGGKEHGEKYRYR